MRCLALDFDGVLCDSAGETAESAWRAGAGLFEQWRGRPVPPDLVEAFRTVRPVLETGFEAIPLLYLVWQGVPTERILADFAVLRDERIAEWGVARDELVSRFGAARDRWIAEDLDGWLARHRFYPGVIERVRARLSTDEVFILTTKQERFVEALLQPVCPEFPAERIFGLDQGRSKEEILRALVRDGERAPASVHFVEDRLQTLERVAACPELRDVRLYFAAWGYNLAADVEAARRHPRITVWREPAEFF